MQCRYCLCCATFCCEFNHQTWSKTVLRFSCLIYQPWKWKEVEKSDMSNNQVYQQHILLRPSGSHEFVALESNILLVEFMTWSEQYRIIFTKRLGKLLWQCFVSKKSYFCKFYDRIAHRDAFCPLTAEFNTSAARGESFTATGISQPHQHWASHEFGKSYVFGIP